MVTDCFSEEKPFWNCDVGLVKTLGSAAVSWRFGEGIKDGTEFLEVPGGTSGAGGGEGGSSAFCG